MSDEKGAAIHNNFVVKILRHNELAADLLANYVPEETAARIDWARLTCEPTALSAEPNKQYVADMIFSAPFKDSDDDATFFVILEHKSDVEKTLPLQLLKYVALKTNELAANRTGAVAGRVPYPIPLVLYHGERPWTNLPTLRDLTYTAPELSDFIPEIRHLTLDVAAIKVEDLRGGLIIRTFLEILKRVKDKTLKPAIRGIFRRLGSIPWDTLVVKDAIRSIYFYLADAARNEGDALTLADIRDAANDIDDEEKRCQVKNFADELEEIGYARGVNSARERVAASEAGRNVRRRFGDSVPSELIERIEAVNYYPTLEKINDFIFESKDLNDFIAAVEPLLK